MSLEERRSQNVNPPHGDGEDQRSADQDRTLLSIHELEDALAAPAPQRLASWLARVLDAISTLKSAMANEAKNAERPDSLLSDIAFNQPRLRNRVRGIRTEYHELQHDIEALGHKFEAVPDRTVDFADIRQQLASLTTALRHQRARESDLIYEAYYEAFRTDLRQDTSAPKTHAHE